MAKKIFAKLYIALILVVLYAPIVFIAVFSFTEAKSLGNWTGFSFSLYKSLFTGGMQNSSGLISAVNNTEVLKNTLFRKHCANMKRTTVITNFIVFTVIEFAMNLIITNNI